MGYTQNNPLPRMKSALKMRKAEKKSGLHRNSALHNAEQYGIQGNDELDYMPIMDHGAATPLNQNDDERAGGYDHLPNRSTLAAREIGKNSIDGMYSVAGTTVPTDVAMQNPNTGSYWSHNEVSQSEPGSTHTDYNYNRSFDAVFADARKKHGADGTFSWRGGTFNTRRADDAPLSRKSSSPMHRDGAMKGDQSATKSDYANYKGTDKGYHGHDGESHGDQSATRTDYENK